MKNINQTLQEDTDAGMLPLLAKFWKANIAGLERDKAVEALSAARVVNEPVDQERTATASPNRRDAGKDP